MKIAYADPPYIGQAKRHYEMPEVDHYALIKRLQEDFPDGWALSCSSNSLGEILGYCEAFKVRWRIGAWVKPFHAFKRGVRPAYAWEPVIYTGGRNPPWHPHPPPLKNGKATTPKDWVSVSITLKKGLVGAKPEAFSFWLFELMGMQPTDKLVDIFIGTGAVTDAWLKWCELHE